MMSDLESIFRPTVRDELCVIAEAGVNHDGDVDEAHVLIDLAADAGADAVKFQTFDPASLVSAEAKSAPYQIGRTRLSTQMELLQQYVLPPEAWSELSAHAVDRGLAFMSTAFDRASLDLVCSLGVRALKLGSGELTNRPLLLDVASRELPVICSTGMGTESEVTAAVGWLSGARRLALMHCVSSYPAPVEQANLRAIPGLAASHQVPVGWSDHTVGAVSAIAAVALGATLLEKHITSDSSRSGPDHAASADPESFTLYVSQVRAASVALGDGVKKVVRSEAENVNAVRRSWHAVRDLEPGQRITRADVDLLRPASGIAASVDVIGGQVVRAVPRGRPLVADDVAIPEAR